MEEKNKYPWETLDTTTLYNPLEIVVYHLYRYGKSKSKSAKDLTLVKSYIKEQKELGVGTCFQKR